VTGYSTEGWGDLFLAAAGATAALSGLIFVGLSVNIRTVLDIDKQVGSNFLTGRAIEALVALLSVLVISLVALTPTIARGVLAAFILLTAATSAISPVRAVLASRSQRQLTVATAWRLVTATSLTLTLLAAGATLAAGHGGGLDWLPASFVLAVAVAAINAWILLVEILR
jgi:modulator of FtsH protease